MSLALAALSTIVGGFLVALAIVLIRFNRQRLRIARIAAAATIEDLESIYGLIQETTREQPCGRVLARTNQKATHTRCIVRLPQGLDDFPWSGRTVEIESAREVALRFIEEPVSETAFVGSVLRPVLVPRIKLSSGKIRNVFSPKRLVASSALCQPRSDGRAQRVPTTCCRTCCALEGRVSSSNRLTKQELARVQLQSRDPEWPTVRAAIGDITSSCRFQPRCFRRAPRTSLGRLQETPRCHASRPRSR